MSTRPHRVSHRRSLALLCASFLTLLACPAQDTTTPEPKPTAQAVDPAQRELAARLAYLEQRLEQARVDSHVPGMAIAIVKDDELIWAKGFGVSDLDAETPVTPETVFAIGSSTKAFTATLVGMLVDEGKIAWDDPVTKHLPELTLQIEGAKDGEVATIRDLLCHRSGFSRMGLLWAGNAIPRTEVFAHASKAEPVAPFRAEFHYNNVTFMAAGEAAGRAAGTTWEELVTTRLLEPLAMTHSTIDYAGGQADPDLAKGYTWREDLGRYMPKPMRKIDIIGPAGSINSSVLDMANWLRFQLGAGEFEGQRLISAEALHETHTAQIEVAPKIISYGMGWMLRDWQGHRVVEHGGNIDGFAASVALLPDDGIGMVLLTNTSMTPLQGTGHTMVWEALLTDAYLASAEGDGASEDFSRLVGKYNSDIPSFGGEPLEILVKDGKLAIDVPGQMVFTLAPPDDDGLRSFEQTNEVAISFDLDDDGGVVALRLHQAGMMFEALREGVELEPEVDVAEVRPKLGHYAADVGVNGEVLIHNGRLAFDIPGQLTFDLELPEADGDYHFRANYDMFLTFDEDKKSGAIVGLTMFQNGKAVKFERLPDPTTISLEQLHNKRKTDKRQQALERAGVIRFVQTLDLINAGAGGTGELWFDATGRLRQDIDFGELGSSVQVLDASSGWVESSMQPLEALEGEVLTQALHDHPRVMFGDWREHFTDEAIVRTEQRDGREIHVVEVRVEGLPPSELHVDAKTGDVIEVHSRELTGTALSVPVVTKLSDYRKVKGLRLPHRLEVSNAHTGTTVITVSKVETKQDPGTDRFVPMPKR